MVLKLPDPLWLRHWMTDKKRTTVIICVFIKQHPLLDIGSENTKLRRYRNYLAQAYKVKGMSELFIKLFVKPVFDENEIVDVQRVPFVVQMYVPIRRVAF